MSKAPRKREPLGRTWWRASTGIGTDLKYRTVASIAGPGVDAAQVAGVWLAMLDHAAQSRPRGSIVTFDHRDYAEFSGLDRDVTARIVTALREKGLHDGHAVTKWADHQAPKVDRTAAERKKRQRERERSAKAADESGEMPEMADGHGVTPVTKRDGGDVTPRDRQRESLAISRQLTSSSASTTASPPRAGARAHEGISKQQLWHEIQGLGVDVPLSKRWKHRASIATWVDRGITAEQLAEAHRRASRRREADGDPRPITVPFLEPFVAEVLDGLVPRNGAEAPAPAKPTGPSKPPPAVAGPMPEFEAVHQDAPKSVGEAIASLAKRFHLGGGSRS